MSKLSDQIRQDYREAVASAIEGKDNVEAWNRVSTSLAKAIFSAWLSSAAKTAQGIPECEITKMLYAKSDCGAGKDSAPGFQPGNTCAGEGGSRERQRVTRNELTEPEQAIVSAMVESGSAEDSVQALYRSEEDAINFILDNYEDVTYDEEGNGLIKWREDGKKTINALKDYWYTRTQEFIEKKFGDVDTITMYRGDYSDRHGTYETPQFVSTDKSTAEFYTTSDLGSHSGRERKVVEYEVPVEDILMCQECLPGQFAEDAFLIPPEVLNLGKSAGEGGERIDFKSLSTSELHELTTDELMSEVRQLEKEGKVEEDFPWMKLSDEQFFAVDKEIKKDAKKPKLGVNPLGRAKKLDWLAPTWDYRGWLIEEQPWDEDDQVWERHGKLPQT